MRGLGQVEIRCRDHECFDFKCEMCRFLHGAELKLNSLRGTRDRVYEELKQRLVTRELVIIDLR